MNNKSKIVLSLAFSALLLASLACNAAKAPVADEGTAAPEVVDSAPSAEPAATNEPEAAVVESGYEGNWTGTNSDDSEIVFEVTERQITSVTINYQADNNGCTFSGAVSMGIDPSPISGDSFSATFTAPNDYVYTFAGSFTSDTEANGTILVKSPASGMCGEFEEELTWSASKGSASETDSGSTEDSSGSSDTDEIAVVTEFFDAVNTGDLDSALAMVDENVMFSFGAGATQFGRDNLEAFLSSSNVTYQISDTESFGSGMAQFTATVSDGTTYSFCTVLLQGDKIVSISLQP